MTLSLTLACIWVLVATILAVLPMRFQYVPGIALLILAVPLLIFIGMQHGVWFVLLVLAGILSMFRNPLFYFSRRLFHRFKRGES